MTEAAGVWRPAEHTHIRMFVDNLPCDEELKNRLVDRCNSDHREYGGTFDVGALRALTHTAVSALVTDTRPHASHVR